MTKSKFEDKELGNKFIEMGNKFLTYAQENKTVLDFEKGFILKNPECGTVACHSGHACMMLGLAKGAYTDYIGGANAIAFFLGLEDYWGYVSWARANPELWGNCYGLLMFTSEGYKSFGFTEEGECTLEDIGNHYVSVGSRILKSLES